MEKIKNILLFLWQFPQNIIGLFLVILIDCKRENSVYLFRSDYISSFSLGNYIFINRLASNEITLKHEKGHQKQSIYLGWLYIILVGLPSVIGNLVNRFYKYDYYSTPWEHTADMLGGVERSKK